MSTSNSFNICTRCGAANSLSAKYCYQCGAQLKVHEEPVICPKCHTVNSGLANFCRTCGQTLKTGAGVKVCPNCSKEIPVGQAVCSCGYSFIQTSTAPAEQQPAEKAPVALNRKGGRLVAIFGLIFLLLFAYVVLQPWQLDFLKNANVGLLLLSGEVTSGYAVLTDSIIAPIAAGNFAGLLSNIPLFIIYVMFALFLLCAVIHFIAAFVRLFTNKKSKSANIFYLILAIVYTILVGMYILANIVGWNLLSFMKLEDGVMFGNCLYVMAGYFWFFFLFSLFAKAKKGKAD